MASQDLHDVVLTREFALLELFPLDLLLGR
jgi:hypothetical protein